MSTSKEFTVPPVIFPSGPVHRRATAPFQPRPNPSPLPFMSFYVNAGTTSSFPAPRLTPTPSTFYDDEPPLLEELGINTKQIWRKTTLILNPLRVANTNDIRDDADLSGPVLLLMSFGLFQLPAGKIHFGVILGWVTVSALFLYVVFNMLAGRNGTLDLYPCVSLIGYCMLPMVMLSALSLFLPQGGVAIAAGAVVFVTWSARACTKLLGQVARWDKHPRDSLPIFAFPFTPCFPFSSFLKKSNKVIKCL
ncbi:YIPF5 protein [Spatholobus suberectus]|nr:YIPF5 protein [Spatholobus suberectus]